MANVCFTEYVVVFKNMEDAKLAEEILKSNTEEKYGHLYFKGVEDKFGENLNVSWHTTYSESSISLVHNELHFETESDWNQDEWVRIAFERKFPGCNVYFLEEELDEDVYFSNDREQKYFKCPFCVSYECSLCDDNGTEEFETQEEVINLFNELYKLSGTKEECSTLEEIENFLEQEEYENDYFNVYQMTYGD